MVARAYVTAHLHNAAANCQCGRRPLKIKYALPFSAVAGAGVVGEERNGDNGTLKRAKENACRRCSGGGGWR